MGMRSQNTFTFYFISLHSFIMVHLFTRTLLLARMLAVASNRNPTQTNLREARMGSHARVAPGRFRQGWIQVSERLCGEHGFPHPLGLPSSARPSSSDGPFHCDCDKAACEPAVPERNTRKSPGQAFNDPAWDACPSQGTGPQMARPGHRTTLWAEQGWGSLAPTLKSGSQKQVERRASDIRTEAGWWVCAIDNYYNVQLLELGRKKLF